MRKSLFLLISVLVFLTVPTLSFALGTWSYFDAAANFLGVPVHIFIYALVAAFLVVTGTMVGGKYKAKLTAFEQWKTQPAETRGESPITPSPKFSLANLFETMVQATLGMMEDIIGHGAKKYFSLVGTLAFVIFFNNIMVLLPSGNNATTNVNTNAAMAITVFLLYNWYGIRAHGPAKYAAHFMGPLEGSLKYILAPLMIPIELISHIARPVSLTLRLMGNMFGDHTVFAVFMGLLVSFGIGFIPPLGYPVVFILLGTLVCVVQTLVFCLLTTVYISLSVAHDH